MAFSSRVEAWRPLAEQFVNDAPTNYLLDWIRGESGGNRCNITTSAGFPEVGLFQLDPGNAKSGGVDHDTLRLGCSGSTDVDPSPENQYVAMATGVSYINYLKKLAHQRLRAIGTDWDENDPGFWSFVRYHFSAGSGAAQSALSRATTALGRAPTSWNEIVANGSPSAHWADVATQNGLYALGWFPSSAKLSRTEIALMAVAGLASVFGAMAFDRWLHAGKAV
ncbi:MAG: hypothetical protein ACREJC_06520 [Tepidisphaeraceae bacterium]